MTKKKFKKFFNKKKILITGNTGFVGSYLSIVLKTLGSNVLGYSLKKKYQRYLSNSLQYKKNIVTINDDILKIKKHQKKIKKFKPQILIHLAAQPIVKDSYINTKKTYVTNILGSIELLEMVKNISSIKHIIVFTSDKVYENLNATKLNESSNLGGIDPYSASKSSQDIITRSYKESFFKRNKNVIIVRAGNIIGGGDFSFSRLLPEVFFNLFIKKNKKIYLRNPNAIRPWQHILDVVSALLLIMDKFCKKIHHKTIIFNIGPNESSNIAVIKLIKIMSKRVKNLKYSKLQKKSFQESKILKLSNKFITKKTRWKPLLNLETAIKLTVDWYECSYKHPKKIFAFTINEINSFLNKMN